MHGQKNIKLYTNYFFQLLTSHTAKHLKLFWQLILISQTRCIFTTRSVVYRSLFILGHKKSSNNSDGEL